MSTDTFLYKLLFLIVVILVAANLLLWSFYLYAAGVSGTSRTAGRANMAVVAKRFGHALDSTGHAINSGARSVVTAAAHSASVAADSSAKFIAGSVVDSYTFVFHTADTVFGSVANTAVVSAVIKPADHTPVPVIDTHSPVLVASAAPAPPVQTAAHITPQADSEPIWPIHGKITTPFGVPHWPYQPIHTGLDISDGQRSGVTPIVPFKPGRVVEAVHSYSGLGNHVVIDNGGGTTSVYGHLASISAQVGQAVVKTTTLGFEGSTGASTGTHLHFEIRVNGQPVNPQQFISGHP